MNIKIIYENRNLFGSFFIYSFENFITILEINIIVDEYIRFLHSSIISSLIFILNSRIISHSIINILFIVIRRIDNNNLARHIDSKIVGNIFINSM